MTMLSSMVLAVMFASALQAAGRADTRALRVDVDARAFQPGELIVFTIEVPAVVATAVTVRVFGRDVAAVPQNGHAWTALVGIDLGAKPGAVTATVTAHTAGGPLSTRHRFAVSPKRFPTRRLRVAPTFVEPPDEVLPRIERERARVSDIFSTPASGALWTGRFLRPVPHPVNSAFGRRSVFNGRRLSPHTGIDFRSPEGTPIAAPNAGAVRLAEHLYFAGNTVIVDHGLGLFSLFAHLSEFRVKEGDTVAAGDVVGLVGATGRVTGPHLHWAVRVGGARIDPLALLDLLGK
jgi:murein DD-endopeptidase MepM/ murein hydrolase activator NlpD